MQRTSKVPRILLPRNPRDFALTLMCGVMPLDHQGR